VGLKVPVVKRTDRQTDKQTDNTLFRDGVLVQGGEDA